jgi:hypothetical protein
MTALSKVYDTSKLGHVTVSSFVTTSSSWTRNAVEDPQRRQQVAAPCQQVFAVAWAVCRDLIRSSLMRGRVAARISGQVHGKNNIAANSSFIHISIFVVIVR